MGTTAESATTGPPPGVNRGERTGRQGPGAGTSGRLSKSGPVRRLLVAAVICLFAGDLVALAVIAPPDASGPDTPADDDRVVGPAPASGGLGDLSASGSRVVPPTTVAAAGAQPAGGQPGASQTPGQAAGTTLAATSGPPRPGGYTYRTVRVADGRRSQADENETVGASNGGRVFVDSGRGREEWMWTATAAALVASGTEGGPRCQFEPPVVWLAFPMRVGATWSGTSRCTIDVPDYGTVQVERAVSAKVVRADKVDAVGGQVPVWVVETQEKIVSTSRRTAPPPSGSPSIPGEIRSESDIDWTLEFAPSLGVAVRQVGESKSKSSFDDKTREQRTERVLLTVPS